MKMRFVTAMTAALTIAGAGCGTETKDTFVVRGIVIGSPSLNDVLAGVEVSCGADTKTTTKTDGSYSLTCPLPEPAESGSAAAALVSYSANGRAPAARSLIPSANAEYTVVPIMVKLPAEASVDIPAGNTLEPHVMESATLSFSRQSLLDVDGTAATGTVSLKVADWDNSLPVEDQEDSGTVRLDSLYPALPTLRRPDSNVWMRPVAAVWFDTGELSVNPSSPVEMQLSTRFGNNLVGREIDLAGDANLFFIDPSAGAAIKADGAAITARNLLSASLDTDGLWVWMVPDAEAACVNVTVRKGDLPASGAQVATFETFNDELQLFYDEVLGSENGEFCMMAKAAREVLIVVTLAGNSGVIQKTARLLAGGNASCGGACTPATIVFPCEINADCNSGSSCLDGICTASTQQ